MLVMRSFKFHQLLIVSVKHDFIDLILVMLHPVHNHNPIYGSLCKVSMHLIQICRAVHGCPGKSPIWLVLTDYVPMSLLGY